ncbi:hypothetical protein NL676_020721 [Syzygium grande]|nr:hypothetical protein NL676_020721 [Syzygium grande]
MEGDAITSVETLYEMAGLPKSFVREKAELSGRWVFGLSETHPMASCGVRIWSGSGFVGVAFGVLAFRKGRLVAVVEEDLLGANPVIPKVGKLV